MGCLSNLSQGQAHHHLITLQTSGRYREGRYPENMETLTISNTSVMEADVLFSFKNDFSATTFLVEPAQMVLKPGESKVYYILFNY